MGFYSFVLVVVTLILGGLANVRLADLMVTKWKVTSDTGGFTIIATTIAALIVLVFASIWAFRFGGLFYQVLIAFPGSIVMIGLTWGFVIGVIKTFERMLLGLCTRMN